MSNKMDSLKVVYVSGAIYYEFWDDGDFVLRCTRILRDRILEKSGLPLKLIDSDVVGILTDF